MNRIRPGLSDPQAVASWIAVAMIVAAFASFYIAWRGAAATLAVALQLPYAVSGGVGGLILLVTGASLLVIQARRRRHARERRLLEGALAEAYRVLDAVYGDDSAR